MTAFVMQNMAPLMFAALVVMLLLGYPVAFSLAANGIFFGLVHEGLLPSFCKSRDCSPTVPLCEHGHLRTTSRAVTLPTLPARGTLAPSNMSLTERLP